MNSVGENVKHCSTPKFLRQFNVLPNVTGIATCRHFLTQNYSLLDLLSYCLSVIVLCSSVVKMPRDAWCDGVTPRMLLLQRQGRRHMLCRCNFTQPSLSSSHGRCSTSNVMLWGIALVLWLWLYVRQWRY